MYCAALALTVVPELGSLLSLFNNVPKYIRVLNFLVYADHRTQYCAIKNIDGGRVP